MKKVFLMMLLFTLSITVASAQKNVTIEFDKTTHNFGDFPADKQMTCVFKFTNTGNDLLIIHQAVAACGCTVASYTKEPVKPGESGEISVTYNGARMNPGHFKKRITVRSNAETEMTRLYIEGNMLLKEK